MKKVLSMAAVAALSFSLVGCGSGDTTSTSDEQVTLRYANWNLGTEEENNIERQMIAAFEEANPNIDIEIAEEIDPANWGESLASAASSGKMPDVFMVNSVPEAMANGWMYDISELANNDSDWGAMPEVVRNAITYGEEITAVPFGQHFMGYVVNEDVFEAENLDVPEFGLSLADFEQAVKDVTKVNTGKIAFEDVGTLADWYPSALSEEYGYYTYADGKLTLDSTEYIQGVNKAKEYNQNSYVYNSLSDDLKANFKGTNGYEAWVNNEVAFKWEGTWAAKSLLTEMPFKSSFIGIPGGRNIVVNDYVGISASTEHADAAYEFAKYMSFSKEGYQKRIDLSVESDTPLSSLPLMNDQELIDAYMEVTNLQGVDEAYENIENAYVEGLKTVPGYENARFKALTGVKIGDIENATIGDLIFHAQMGNVKIEDYAKQLNELANQQLTDAAAAIQ
ncbi:MAG: ABC transporter substrate-binding protein [Culicoidibacterales bacterium]